MKSLIRILLACLISSTSYACGWYPFGEDVRFSLMSPDLFDDGGMSPYYYTAWGYGYGFKSTPENDPNVALWKAYCDDKVDAAAIYEAIYELNTNEFRTSSRTNKMVAYIDEDMEAMDYIIFAKSCSGLNSTGSDWELEDNGGLERNKKILKALKRSQQVSSPEIKKRYRFLAVRLAFYNRDQETVQRIFSKSFSKSPKDAIDYWALYFNNVLEDKSAKRNFNLSQVFVNAPGKRFGVLTNINMEIPMDEVLAFARTDQERANVHVMYAIRNRGRSLFTLKTVQKLDPQNPLLNFLLVREVNKIEDWVLTPRYTNFNPAIDVRRESYGESNDLIKERIKDDEKYCREVADWIGTLKLTPDNTTWNIAEAYLSGIYGKYIFASELLGGLNSSDEETTNMIDQLALLFKVSVNAEKGYNYLSEADKEVLMNDKTTNYDKFLFAVSREFEFQKKFDMAAALFSRVNKKNDFYSGGVTWKSGSGKETLRSDYFYSWFLYLDAEYSPEELQSVIDFAQAEFDKSSKFDQWQREFLVEDLDKLYDLLGTKYIRQNNIDASIAAFENVGGDLWNQYPFADFLDANPFYANFYSGHRANKQDTVQYTKLELVKKYKKYLSKAENPKTKNRAYYYFLVANCELNMSHYGNSWMMRRYYWTGSIKPNYLEDDDEFFRVKRAQEFYQKAMNYAKSDELKALCLRMKGRCEKHQLRFDAPDSWDFDYDKYGGFNNYVFSKNKSYRKLKEEYPADAEELISNCYSFERYFAKLEN